MASRGFYGEEAKQTKKNQQDATLSLQLSNAPIFGDKYYNYWNWLENVIFKVSHHSIYFFLIENFEKGILFYFIHFPAFFDSLFIFPQNSTVFNLKLFISLNFILIISIFISDKFLFLFYILPVLNFILHFTGIHLIINFYFKNEFIFLFMIFIKLNKQNMRRNWMGGQKFDKSRYSIFFSSN